MIVINQGQTTCRTSVHTDQWDYVHIERCTLYWRQFKGTGLIIIVNIKTYLVTSNEELLVDGVNQCEKRLPLNVVFEKGVISHESTEYKFY